MAEETLPVESSTVPAAVEPKKIQPKKKSFFEIFREWPVSRKIALAGVVVISIAVFSLLIVQGRTADYQLLYANLGENDAAPVVAWLKAEKVPYQLRNNGSSIWVPAKILHETRLSLASNGLPSGGGVGFEVFDKQSFALTDYVQKVNYTRALQGELARTITSLAPVNSARVHLALPEKRLFKNQQKQATASVIVSLAAGQSLNQQQVQGIINLVSGSVTGLNPDNISIIDSNGVVLDDGKSDEGDKFASVDMLSFQQEVERRLELRAQTLLDKTMGKDKAMVRVNAALDFSKVEKTQELFDAEEPVIRSEQVNQESSGTPSSGGIPGVQSNLQGTAPTTGPDANSSRTSRTTNYEISKTVSKIVNPVGTIQKLSVSILVADKETPATENSAATTEARSAEELKSIETMVSAALGLVQDRGDQINVLSMPFTESPEDKLMSETIPANLLYEYLPIFKLGLVAVGVLFLYFLLVRPMIKTVKGEVKEHYKTVEAMEKERLESEKTLAIEQKKRDEIAMEDPIVGIRREILDNPIPAAHIIKHWLQET